MTRLFNLESYIECCQYARLFEKSNSQFIPHPGDLPREYKFFLQKYVNHPYLSEPIWGSSHPQKLEINSGTLDSLSIGTELNQGDKQELFIIRDTVDLMTLSMSHLLEHRDGYLYSSAYHYWNHYSELSCRSTKPLIFIDLDSFGYDYLIPINFSRIGNNPYQIPVLNTREPITLDSAFQPIETYNHLCQSIASYILTENFSEIAQNLDAVHHLANYLQKIAFFQRLQSDIAQQLFSLIIEIAHNSQIFYKRVTLSRDAIAQLVYQAIDTQYLHNLAIRHPQYQFALISQYNIFPQIPQILPQYICLNPKIQEFHTIWQAKNQCRFPLFAIYLDQIEFAVAISNETGGISKQWIQLFTQEKAISYEGKSTTLIGRIPSVNQDFFRITRGNQKANLPIKINGKDYCINNIPQDYNIEVEKYQGTEDVSVRIEFHLQPGSFPELKVTDIEGKYKITACLIDRKQKNYSYIPPEKIVKTRQEQSLAQINRLRNRKGLEQFQTDLWQIAEELKKIENGCPPSEDATIKLKDILYSAWQIIHRNNNRLDILQFIDASSTESVVTDLQKAFKNCNLRNLVEIICLLISSCQPSKLSLFQKDFLVETIIFIGKTYQLSQYLFPDDNVLKIKFFEIKKIKHRQLENEYFQCLARIAINKNIQNQYFNYFDSYHNLSNSQYLWGYGRILLWYYNFKYTSSIINYQRHFIAIMNYLLSKSANTYSSAEKQNAFLSLLYLLTFRANDPTFCQQGSEEMRMAQRVLHHFQDDRILLRQVSNKKPLNQFFQEMIEGNSTEEDVNCLLHT